MNKLVNLYNTNSHVHSFVQGLVGAIVMAIGTWGNGVPTNKAAWFTFAAFIGRAAFSWYTRWQQTQPGMDAVSTPASKLTSNTADGHP